MPQEKSPATDFGDGGVGSQKESFVGNAAGVVPDDRRIPDENPTLMEGDGGRAEGASEGHGSGETAEGRPPAGLESAARLMDAQRHSGLSGDEASIGD